MVYYQKLILSCSISFPCLDWRIDALLLLIINTNKRNVVLYLDSSTSWTSCSSRSTCPTKRWELESCSEGDWSVILGSLHIIRTIPCLSNHLCYVGLHQYCADGVWTIYQCVLHKWLDTGTCLSCKVWMKGYQTAKMWFNSRLVKC